MKITFWSSTEYSGFLAGLIRELNANGLSAKQSFGISEESYRAAKSSKARLFLRFRQYVVYPLQLVSSLIGACLSRKKDTAKQDYVVVSTNTFYAPLIATFFHPRVVHLVYDLFPEAMIHAGKWREGSLKVKMMRWVVKHTLRRSKSNVFLGKRLMEYVESIHGVIPNASIIAVGADQALFLKSPLERARESKAAHSPELLYCGNFGNMHDSKTLEGYWNSLRESENVSSMPRFKFLCSGPKRAALESSIKQLPITVQERITLGGGLSQEDWVQAMESADIALVTMSPGSETVVMPSKTYSAMMAGQAILAIAPENSDLVDLIKETECGWWVEPDDVVGLKRVLVEITSNAEALMSRRERGYLFAQSHFGQDKLALEWNNLFDSFNANE